MSLFPVVAGQCPFGLAAVAATDAAREGVILNAAGTLTRAALAAGVGANVGTAGLTFTATGQLLVVDATAGLPANTIYNNGLPISPAGALCVANAAAAYFNHELPYAANGAIAGTIA